MEIAYLADHPEYINKLSKWFSEEWYSEGGGYTEEGWRSKLLQHLNSKNLPLTVVAQKNKECVGAASVVFHDIESHKHLSPWLSNVYVIPECRNRGIGTYLAKTLIRKCKEMGYDKLYFHQLEDLAEHYLGKYQALGLVPIDKTRSDEGTILVMEINLSVPSGHLSSQQTIKIL